MTGDRVVGVGAVDGGYSGAIDWPFNEDESGGTGPGGTPPYRTGERNPDGGGLRAGRPLVGDIAPGPIFPPGPPCCTRPTKCGGPDPEFEYRCPGERVGTS